MSSDILLLSPSKIPVIKVATFQLAYIRKKSEGVFVWRVVYEVAADGQNQDVKEILQSIKMFTAQTAGGG